jgi:rod shape determining protein RodA
MTQTEFLRRETPSGPAVYGGHPPWRRVRIDGILLVLLLLLMAVGITVLYSASGRDTEYVERQMLFMGAGIGLMLVIAQVPLRFMERWAVLPYVVGDALLFAVFFFGTGVKGAVRWLDLGFMRFQPSEILRVAAPLMLSSYLSQRVLPPDFTRVSIALGLAIVPAILVGVQPDLGTALLISAAGFFVLFLAGIGKRYLFGAGLAAAVAAPVFWIYLLHDYQRKRILTLLDPQSDKLGAGWNIIQSTTAIGSGGWHGKGWFEGTQSQLDFLPESHTDFIIAVLGEEFGLVGVVLLLTLYGLVVLRGGVIALGAQTMFGRLLAGSITLTFSVYVFVNMGMVSGILPVVGVPLPLVSYGGTSIMTLMIGFGMLMAVSTEKQRMRA